MRHTRTSTLLLAVVALACAAAAGEPPARVERGNLIYDGIPAAAMAAPATLTGWQDSRGATFLDWFADGNLLVSMRTGDTTQLQRVRAPLATPEPLTQDVEPIADATAHPYDANLLVYRKDHGGDGNMQLWLRDLAKGSERPLTDGKSRHGPPVFAHDGRHIAYYGNARDAASNDIFTSDIGSAAGPRLVLAGGSEDLAVEDWSLDDKYLAVIRFHSRTDSELLLVDVASGEQTVIEPAPHALQEQRRSHRAGDPVAVGEARFARDGRGLYFTSDHGGEFMALHYLDLHTHQLGTLTPDVHWNVERFDLSPDGRFVAYTLNEAGLSRLVLRDLHLQADVLLPSLPAGAVIDDIAFDRRSNRLAIALQSARSPPEILVCNIAVADPATLPAVTLASWTRGELGGIDPAKLVSAQLVEFPTWDQDGDRQRRLSAFVFQPTSPGPHPAIIDIHGGPEAQFRPRWDAFLQYLVSELGYIVVAPNVRGSSGYGRSFLQLDDGALHGDAVRDIGALLVWMNAQRDFDRNRVVVMGESRGGYMALASLMQYGDRLAGGIDSVGISPDMGALLTASSPLSNAASIRKPLLIVQGLNDPAVPTSESEQIKNLVRAEGGEVWYLAAKDEGRGLRKKINEDAYQAAASAFLKHVAATASQ